MIDFRVLPKNLQSAVRMIHFSSMSVLLLLTSVAERAGCDDAGCLDEKQVFVQLRSELRDPKDSYPRRLTPHPRWRWRNRRKRRYRYHPYYGPTSTTSTTTRTTSAPLPEPLPAPLPAQVAMCLTFLPRTWPLLNLLGSIQRCCWKSMQSKLQVVASVSVWLWLSFSNPQFFLKAWLFPWNLPTCHPSQLANTCPVIWDFLPAAVAFRERWQQGFGSSDWKLRKNL